MDQEYFNPFPNDKLWTLPYPVSLQTTTSDLMKIAENPPKGYKTLWKKEKLLVTSNFSFSNSVFKRLLQQTRKKQGLFGKGLQKHIVYVKDFKTDHLWEKKIYCHLYMLPVYIINTQLG